MPEAHAAAPGSESCPLEYIELAHRLADAAADITRQYFRSELAVEAKGDETPVTIADRKAEAEMRRLLAEALPEHGIFGEEEGLHLPKECSGFLWVLDPIDGTKSFITGKPLFGTLISLLDKGTPILGIIDQPILKERWVGAKGWKTTLNGMHTAPHGGRRSNFVIEGTTVRTRCCKDVREAYLYATTPHMFEGRAATGFERVRTKVLHPLYGCDCYAYGLLACGLCDLVIEADLKAYDYMAQVPIIEGAGGIITDWQGQSLRWPVTPSNSYALQDLSGEIAAAGDVRAHRQALKLLSGREEGGGPSQAENGMDVCFKS